MSKDPNGDCDNRYHIRSLYFDDIHNNAYYEKLNGIKKESTEYEFIIIVIRL